MAAMAEVSAVPPLLPVPPLPDPLLPVPPLPGNPPEPKGDCPKNEPFGSDELPDPEPPEPSSSGPPERD